MPNRALTNSTELLQIVEIFSPGLRPRAYQIIGKAIGIVFDLGKGHPPRAICQRYAFGKPAPPRGFRRSPIGHPPDAAGTGYTAGYSQIAHELIRPSDVLNVIERASTTSFEER